MAKGIILYLLIAIFFWGGVVYYKTENANLPLVFFFFLFSERHEQSNPVIAAEGLGLLASSIWRHLKLTKKINLY